jgi:hypothetical protein
MPHDYRVDWWSAWYSPVCVGCASTTWLGRCSTLTCWPVRLSTANRRRFEICRDLVVILLNCCIQEVGHCCGGFGWERWCDVCCSLTRATRASLIRKTISGELRRYLQLTAWSVICRECGNDLQIIGLFSYLIDELMGLRLLLREEVVGGCWWMKRREKRWERDE